MGINSKTSFNKSKISTVFAKCIILVTFALMIWIAFCSLFAFGRGTSYLQSVVNHPQFLIIIGTVLGISALFLVFNYIDNCSDKNIRLITVFSIFCILAIQILFVCCFDVIQTHDQYDVNDEALAVANGIYDQAPFSTLQLKIYNNNHFLFVATILFYKVLNFIGFSNYSLALFILNIVLIDLSVFFICQIARLVKNKRFAVKLLLLNVFNPINYIFIFWTYSCTYSLPLMTGIVYFAILLFKNNYGFLRRIALGALISLTAIVGYFLRPTVIIPLIAIIICFIIKERIFCAAFLKKYVSVFLAMVIVAFGSFSFIKYEISRYIPDTSKNFPITHWVMMGLHNNGEYNSEDLGYTNSFETKEEKTKANIEEIKRTLSEYGFSGTLKHTLNKIPTTWSYSPFDYSVILNENDTKFSVLYNWVSGEKTDLSSLYSQIFHTCLIILVILSLFSQLKSKKIDYRFLFSLIIFGGIAFYAIWEAKSAYNTPFIPFLILLSCYGLDDSKGSVGVKSNLQALKFTLCIVTASTVVFGLAEYKSFAKDKLTFTDKSVYTTNTNNVNYIDISGSSNQIIQEFYSSKKINKLLILCKNEGKGNSNYRIIVSDSNRVILNTTVNNSDITDNYIQLDLKGVKGGQRNKYRIKIISLNENSESSIKWAYRRSDATDQYDGDFFVGSENKNTDMLIRAYNQYTSPYMSSILYLILFLLLISSETLVIIKLNKQIKHQSKNK